MSDEAPKRSKRTAKLTSQMVAFIHFYMGQAKGDGILAAQMAGYSGTREHLSERARVLLKHPGVINERERIAKLPLPQRPGIMSRIEALEKLSALARLDINDSHNHKGIAFGLKMLLEIHGEFMPEKIIDARYAENMRSAIEKARARGISEERIRDAIEVFFGEPVIDTEGEPSDEPKTLPTG